MQHNEYADRTATVHYSVRGCKDRSENEKEPRETQRKRERNTQSKTETETETKRKKGRIQAQYFKQSPMELIYFTKERKTLRELNISIAFSLFGQTTTTTIRFAVEQSICPVYSVDLLKYSMKVIMTRVFKRHQFTLFESSKSVRDDNRINVFQLEIV